VYIDAEEIENNLQVCGNLSDQLWVEYFHVHGHEDVYEQKSDLGHLSTSFSDFNYQLIVVGAFQTLL
jgi:hypothetical protein